MYTTRFIPLLLLFLLPAWLGGISTAQAGNETVGQVAAARPLTDGPAMQAVTTLSTTTADIRQPARANPGRILFILASSKVHGKSTIPASISFGEVVQAWDIFHAAGYAVDFVSPDGGDLPILDAYVGDEVESRLTDERIMGGLRNTLAPAQIDASRYRAVYYVGGSNAMYGVAEHPLLQSIAMQVYEGNGGVVSAVCHGTAGIVNLTLANGQHLISGKRISGYPEEHEEQDAAYFKEFPFLIRKTVESRGGLFHAIDSREPHVEVDGRVVTGQNYASATPVAEAVVEVLRTLADQVPKPDVKQG